MSEGEGEKCSKLSRDFVRVRVRARILILMERGRDWGSLHQIVEHERRAQGGAQGEAQAGVVVQ